MHLTPDSGTPGSVLAPNVAGGGEASSPYAFDVTATAHPAESTLPEAPVLTIVRTMGHAARLAFNSMGMVRTEKAFDNGADAYLKQENTQEADWALARSCIQTLTIIFLCSVFFALARQSDVLLKYVFAPEIANDKRGPRAFPGVFGVVAEVRQRINEVLGCRVGLEARMVLRYIRLNLRLLCYAILVLAFLVPFYALEPHSPTTWILEASKLDCAAHPTEQGCVRNGWWSVLGAATISHVPNGSWRLVMPGLACAFFSAAYCVELTFEWRAFALSRLRWHERRGIEKHAAVLSVEGEGDAHPDAVAAELARIVGSEELVSIATVHQLRSGEEGLDLLTLAIRGVSKIGEASKALQPPSPLKRVGTALHETSTVVMSQTKSLATLLFCGEVEPKVARFVVLFRSRRACATAVALARWPGEILSKPGYVRVQYAPSPEDVYWPNLLRTREHRAFNYYLGYGITTALYVFYNVPVAFIQGLASVNQLANVQSLAWLSDYVQSLGPRAVATFEGTVASLVLQLFLYLTLYSGLFQFLSRMAGATSHTEICQRTAGRVMLFQIIFVILVSSITSSLFDSLEAFVRKPTDLPFLLAGTLPGQSNFFMHYLLNQILFVYLFDGTQCFALLEFACCVWRGTCCLGRRPAPASEAADGAPPAKSVAGLVRLPDGTWGTEAEAAAAAAAALRKAQVAAASEDAYASMPPYERPSAEARRQRLLIMYAKLTLCSGIFLTYLFIAPVMSAIALLYFLPCFPIYAVLLAQIEGVPEVDTGGAMWMQAIRFQTWTFLIAQTLLAGVLALKLAPIGVGFTVASILYVAYHTHKLRTRYSGIAEGLPVQRLAQLDDVDGLAAPPYDSLHSYADVGAREPSSKS